MLNVMSSLEIAIKSEVISADLVLRREVKTLNEEKEIRFFLATGSRHLSDRHLQQSGDWST